MNRLAIAGLTTIVALAMTGNSFAQGGIWGSGSSNRSGTPEKLAKTVGLTDEQVTKIKEVDASRDKALVDVRAAMDANRQAMKDAYKSGDSDQQTQTFAQSQKLYTQYQEISKKFDDDRMAVLTDDQKTKLKEANDAEALQQWTEIYNRQYQEQAKVCALSEDQIKAMVAIDLARDKAVSEWQKENMDKLTANYNAIQEAIKNGDTEKTKELLAQQQELNGPMWDLRKKGETDALAVMTDAQRATWLEHQVFQNFLIQCAAYKLTADQNAKIKQACHTLAQEKGATITSLYAKLEQETFTNILTDEQKANWLQRATMQYVDSMYRFAKLTDDQKAKVKENYVKLVADNGAQAPSTLKDMKSMWGAAQDFSKKLSPQIDAMLSNEQKAAQDKGMHPKQKSAATSAPANVRS